MFEDFENVVEREVRPLMEGYTFAAHIDDLSVDDLGELFAVLQFLESQLKDRKAAVRQKLLDAVKDHGKSTPKGGQQTKTIYGTAIRERRESKMPDENELKLLLAKRNIPLTLAFTKVSEQRMDPSKIHALIERGKLKKEEVESTRSVAYALKFKPNARTTSLLEDTLGAPEE